MKKNLTIFVGALLLVAGVLFFFSKEMVPQKSSDSHAGGYTSATYIIDNEPITLTDGYYESQNTSESATKTIIQYFGNEAFGDISGDGTPDVVFLITRSDGGSGTFYYVVAGIRSGDMYTGTNAVFIGDRIAPQSTEIYNREAIVNFADRKGDEPFTEQPSHGISLRLQYKDGLLRVLK
jgi:hypothetical protein